MKTIEVKAVWYSYHTVEVPDDFQDAYYLSDFPDEVLEEITSEVAELVDWEVY